ncbi:MAG TPA: MASE1 domain-containing protein [Gemmatimonadales bacterium]|nr:MASE1 domain-containing protein [Gemmatimonadales bacterium]
MSAESSRVWLSGAGRAALPGVRWGARAVALAAAYFLVATLGLRYASIGSSISPVWPPTGLAVAALVLLGPGYWPAILGGAFLANALTPIPLLAAAGIGCGNAAEAVLVAYLLRSRASDHLGLDDLRSVRLLVAVAAPLGALTSAAVGVTSLGLAGVVSESGLLSSLGLWWAGDYLGALVVAPVLLTWTEPAGLRIGGRRALELALLLGGAVIATALIFGTLLPASFLPRTEYPYLLFPFVIWAALRFGPRGASLLTLTVAALAVAYTVAGGGPFVMRTVPSTDRALLLYVGILAITGLVLSPAPAHRQRAERALREANASLRAVIESSPLAIYTLDGTSTVRSWNRAAEALYGWRADEVVGRPLPTIGHDREDHLQLRERVLRGETLRGVEVSRRRKDGSPVTLSLSVAPVYDAAGQVTGMLSIAADLTELRQLEVQYRQAQKMEAVGRLAGGIAHDFNNLLTAILGTTSLLLEDLGPEARVRPDIQEIEKAAKQAAGLTRQLLIFSRQQVLEPRVLDVNALVGDLERMLRRLIGEDIELRTTLDAGLGAVRADPGQLEQAIVNLVVNARDAMPQGGRLTIETANAELDQGYVGSHTPAQPGPYVLLAVSDTGVGMDVQTQARLFEPFFTTKEPGRGTGLGLATVYGIVKQSGGYIWAYSELGRGSTFKMYLPRVAATPETLAAAPAVAPLARGSETILVVEDQEEVRKLAQRVLETRGYTVLTAADGHEALAVAARYAQRIDLLVTDVVMPRINGRELALRIAAVRRNLPVLYVSGYTGEAIREHGLLEPGVAFLQKPFTADALAGKVREVLDAAQRSG